MKNSVFTRNWAIDQNNFKALNEVNTLVKSKIIRSY